METLKWKQDADGLHVSIDDAKGRALGFSIDNSFINHLLAGTPRLYVVYLKLNDNNQECAYILDLEKLRPVIQKKNGLKLVIGKPIMRNDVPNLTSMGLYCLARGESYHDRFLSDSGWQSQRIYKNVYQLMELVKDKKTVIDKDPDRDIELVKDKDPDRDIELVIDKKTFIDKDPDRDIELVIDKELVGGNATLQDDDVDLDLTL